MGFLCVAEPLRVVLAELRTERAELQAFAVKADRQTRERDAGAGHFLQDFERRHLRVLQHFWNRIHRRAGHASLGELGDPVLPRFLGDPVADELDQFSAVFDAGAIATKPQIGGPFRHAERNRTAEQTAGHCRRRSGARRRWHRTFDRARDADVRCPH